MTPNHSKLYAIVDADTCKVRKLSLLDFARAVCAARPCYVQLRAKHTSPRQTLELLRGLVPIAKQYGVLVFANDRADLALLAGTDGVHVGQDDLPVSQVQRVAPGLQIGFSTHNEAQLRAALTQPLHYAAFGPVYSTTSKENADDPVGISGLVVAARLAHAAQIPLVAIGGLTRERIAEVAPYADYVAMIGALVPPSGRLEDVTAHVAELNAHLSNF